MARFVLVHGAFSGAWIWAPLMKRLKANGHSVEALDMPGLGEDHTPIGECTLDASAARVCGVLAAASGPAIVVAHSMGGIIATQAAARCLDRVAALIYVGAFIPKDGQSLLALTKLPEGAGDQVQANIIIEGDPPVAIMPPAASRKALYDCCTDEVVAWAIARQRTQPVAPFATPVSIPAGALDGLKRYAVLCLQDRAMQPALLRRMIAENPCAEVVELDTDHTPQLSMTNELANALNRFAAHASSAASHSATS
jgi:pimeloyl-ACP methyl ester carboxylesterase